MGFIISTGSRSINDLIGGGIRSGMLTDVYGPSGSAKSQLCFSICSNYINKEDDGIALFVDTTGTFRPERILEIIGSESKQLDFLNRIIIIRAFTTGDQWAAIKKISEIGAKLVIIDSATTLFSYEYSGAARHLALMKYLHDLSIQCINSSCAIVITNMVRNVPYYNEKGNQITKTGDGNPSNSYPPYDSISNRSGYYQREFMNSSVSLYAHIRLKLDMVKSDKGIFKANLVQPPSAKVAYFRLTNRGISDMISI